MPAAVSSAEPPWRSGLRSARANLLPGIILQVAAVGLVFAYYRHEPTRAVLGSVGELREKIGVIFSVLSTGFFGGLLPVLYLRRRAAPRDRYTAAQGMALTLFWAYKGFEVDVLYRLLARF